jgi:hypothetical protein
MHFDHYLRHSKFEIVTDHSALTTMLGRPKELKGKFARWAADLLEYNFTIIHREGKKMKADGMSRRPYTDTVDNDPCLPDTGTVHLSAIFRSPGTSTDEGGLQQNGKINTDRLVSDQKDDTFMSAMRNYLQDHMKLPEDEKLARLITMEAQHYFIAEDDLLRRYYVDKTQGPKHKVIKTQLLLPVSMRTKVLHAYHDAMGSTHFAVTKTLNNIKDKYYWPSMTQDVCNYVRTCQACQEHKRPYNQLRPVLKLDEVPEAMSHVTVDLLGPLKTTQTGKKYILCVIDNCTKFPVLHPLPDAKAQTVGRAFYQSWITMFGAPTQVSSDQGPSFISDVWHEMCKYYDVKVSLSCPYVPREHGVVERLQETVQQALSFYLDKYDDQWDIPLQGIAEAIRNAPSATTGYSPNMLLYGRENKKLIDTVLLPPPHAKRTVRDYLQQLITNLETSRETSKGITEKHMTRYKEQFDKRSQNHNFRTGDTVFLFVPRNRKGFSKALSNHWHGPYVIVNTEGELHFKLRKCSDNKMVKQAIHAQRLKHGYLRTVLDETPPDLNDAMDDVELNDDDLPDDSFDTPEQRPIGDATVTNPPEGENNDDNDELEDANTYEVERIIKSRRRLDGRVEYLIKWKDFSAKHNSYVTYDDLNSECHQWLKANPITIKPCTHKK